MKRIYTLIIIAILFGTSCTRQLFYRPITDLYFSDDYSIDSVKYNPFLKGELEQNQVKFITRYSTEVKTFKIDIAEYLSNSITSEFSAKGLAHNSQSNTTISAVIKELMIESYAEKSVTTMDIEFVVKENHSIIYRKSKTSKRTYQEIIALGTTEYNKMIFNSTQECINQFLNDLKQEQIFNLNNSNS